MGSAMQEQFVMKWQDFHSNIAQSFSSLRDEDEFLDVTLACDEDRHIQAHKVIISACSPFFKSMLLKQRSAQHPVLIMPDSVRFEDLISMIDFMYHGEVSVPSDELNTFLSAAKQFKIKGLAEENAHAPRMRNQNRPMYPPGQVKQRGGNVPPDIRQRLPPGIQMVKRPAFDSPPEKRARINPPVMKGHPQPQQQQQFLDDEEEDDITEIREENDGEFGYDEYGNEYDEANMGYDEDGVTQSPGVTSGSSAAGSKMVGLLCPNCRTMCKGVPALKEHMLICKAGASPRGQPPAGAGQPQMKDMVEEPQECHICDKSFKSHRTLDNHMKKQHGLAGAPKPLNVKGRGRPKKSPAMSSGDWQDDGGFEGYQETGVAQPHQRGRPVGQVAPVRVTSDSQPPSRGSQPSTSAAGDNVKLLPGAKAGRGRGQPPAGPGRGQVRRPGPGEDKPDLQKLGMKFGGQISITSSNQPQGGRKQGDGGQGVSVMKMKGDNQVGIPVSIKDATSTKSGSSKSGGESSKADSGSYQVPNVKEEPKDAVDQEVTENFDDYGDGDYGDGNEEDYVGPGAEYLDDPDFTGEDVDADGMDVDLYNQYKNRGEGDYDDDQEQIPLDDEYEEEA